MNLCAVQQISKNYAGFTVLEDITFDINQGDRIGIVGRNGSGKTTIFKLIADIEKPDKGAIYIKKDIKIGYLAQVPSFKDDFLVYDVLNIAFQEIREIEKKMKQIEIEMSGLRDEDDANKLLQIYGSLQEKFQRLGGYELEAEIMRIVNGLGIMSLLYKEYSLLSGGEKTKVSLGMVLLMKPDLFLLDEPTNNLDIQAVDWLEEYLKQYEGTVVVISHDRYFLDNLATKIFDIDHGELSIYHTNYSEYVKEKEAGLMSEFDAYQDQQKKIKKMKEAIKRLREFANKGNPPNEKFYRRAASMEKALERLEKLKKPNINPKRINLNFEVNERSGKEVVSMEHIEKSFHGKKLLDNISLHVRYEERVAIIGGNGSGKTTLLKILLNEYIPDHGEVEVGSNVQIGYLSQNLIDEYETLHVIEAFREKVIVTEEMARHILAKFLFYGNIVFKQIKDLSGGEKIRLRLAQLMYQDINLLILDEPTNHLDIDSREELEEALAQFNGTIICISHDRYFLNKLFPITYWLEKGRLIKYEGNYSYAKSKRDEITTVINTNEIKEKTKRENDKGRKSLNKMKNASKSTFTIEQIERKIHDIETELLQIETQMNQKKEYHKLIDLQIEKEAKEKERDLLYKQLENLFN